MGIPADRAPSFTPAERRVIARLDSPVKVQRWLDTLPYNREKGGPTIRSFRGVVRDGTAHCLEAALSAATVLEAHGHPPVLLDLESFDDLDHVVLLFREGGRLGTVARSRYPGLHGRKPAFRTVRGLVESYVDPFVDATGHVTGYGIYDLRDLPRRIDWRTSRRNLWAVEQVLIAAPHRPWRTPEPRIRALRRRYLAFKRRHPDREPAAYRGRQRWL